MQAVSEISREERRVINAIHDLSELEAQIPACKTIDEVEEIRLRCQAIQFYDRERQDMGPMIVAWAKRCAVLCQLRITEIQEGKRAKKNGDITSVSNVVATPTQKVRNSEARLVAALPPEELEEHLKTSGSVQLIARKVRKMRKKPELKTSPEVLERRMARYYRDKKEKQPAAQPPVKLGPRKKFERYWTQEEKLLRQSFAASDLSVIADFWLKEFQSYRTEVEDGERGRNEALAKLKTTTTQGTDHPRE